MSAVLFRTSCDWHHCNFSMVDKQTHHASQPAFAGLYCVQICTDWITCCRSTLLCTLLPTYGNGTHAAVDDWVGPTWRDVQATYQCAMGWSCAQDGYNMLGFTWVWGRGWSNRYGLECFMGSEQRLIGGGGHAQSYVHAQNSCDQLYRLSRTSMWVLLLKGVTAMSPYSPWYSGPLLSGGIRGLDCELNPAECALCCTTCTGEDGCVIWHLVLALSLPWTCSMPLY